jgi:oxygen-independent coproporphyrinogen-3 oxidase
VPDEEAMADFYIDACERLPSAGIVQYEISNFARAGFESRHNLKYWTRQPYFGFGVDAHSMLISATPEIDAVRFAPADSLDQYVNNVGFLRTPVSLGAALEESFFLGLRLNGGVSMGDLAVKFGDNAIENARAAIAELISGGLIEQQGELIRLTSRGRLLSNDVFERFILEDGVLR